MAATEILPAFSYACGMISAKLSHGERVLLENVFFSLSSGERLAVIGETGSGKTMLMRAMCGLIRLNSGTVEMNGKILGKDMAFLENTGILIESPAFLNGYTIEKGTRFDNE